MIEYIYDAIRARAGEDITITAKLTDNEGNIIRDTCYLRLSDNDKNFIAKVKGVIVEDVVNFTIPADATANLIGRYWYCIGDEDTSYCFRQPIYLK